MREEARQSVFIMYAWIARTVLNAVRTSSVHCKICAPMQSTVQLSLYAKADQSGQLVRDQWSTTTQTLFEQQSLIRRTKRMVQMTTIFIFPTIVNVDNMAAIANYGHTPSGESNCNIWFLCFPLFCLWFSTDVVNKETTKITLAVMARR